MSLERQEYNENTPWWGEHIHRYHMVYPYLTENGTILDIACGNGFGSYLLSQKPMKEVIGADISNETIEDCNKKLKQANLKFQVIDGTNIPYADEYFDTIVSFETIEHTTAYKKMIQEFARTIKKSGTVLISTPNFIVNSPEGKVTNPYHTQEFTYDELSSILKEVFVDVKITGQKYTRYDSKTVRNAIGKGVESILYLRGFRKTPLALQNLIMRVLINKNMYPSPDDYYLTEDKIELLKCKTFFAVCKMK